MSATTSSTWAASVSTMLIISARSSADMGGSKPAAVPRRFSRVAVVGGDDARDGHGPASVLRICHLGRPAAGECGAALGGADSCDALVKMARQRM